jgi:tRNA(adenine34) deaminase
MPWNATNARWMKRAIALAREGEGEPPGKNPIGCVIVRDGQVIGEACNEVDLRHDATAHAEILAMGRAGARLKCNELTDAVLYTMLQPCGMCTMAIVYGAGRDDVHEMYFEDRHLEISYELFGYTQRIKHSLVRGIPELRAFSTYAANISRR